MSLLPYAFSDYLNFTTSYLLRAVKYPVNIFVVFLLLTSLRAIWFLILSWSLLSFPLYHAYQPIVPRWGVPHGINYICPHLQPETSPGLFLLVPLCFNKCALTSRFQCTGKSISLFHLKILHILVNAHGQGLNIFHLVKELSSYQLEIYILHICMCSSIMHVLTCCKLD